MQMGPAYESQDQPLFNVYNGRHYNWHCPSSLDVAVVTKDLSTAHASVHSMAKQIGAHWNELSPMGVFCCALPLYKYSR